MRKFTFKRISKHPEVIFIKLPNKTETIYLNIFFRDLIFLEDEKEIGLSHFWEHYLLTLIGNKFKDVFYFNGQVGISGLEFLFEFQTQADYKYLKEILSIIFNPVSVEESTFQKEKRVILDEIENGSVNTERKLFILSQQSFFENPGRLKYPIYGTLEKVRSYSFTQFLNFWRKILDPRLIKIFIGSYYLPPNLGKDILNFFSSVKFSNGKLPKISFKYAKSKVTIEDWQFDKKINVVLNFPGLSILAPLRERYLESALCRVVVKSSEYGIFDDLRNLGIYSFDWAILRFFYFGIISFKISCNKENIYKALSILIQKLLALRSLKIPSTKIQNQFNLDVLRDGWKTNRKFYDWVIDDLINTNQVFPPQKIISIIKSLNSQDIQRTAKNLNFKNFSLIVLGKNATKSVNKQKLLSLIRTFNKNLSKIKGNNFRGRRKEN